MVRLIRSTARERSLRETLSGAAAATMKRASRRDWGCMRIPAGSRETRSPNVSPARGTKYGSVESEHRRGGRHWRDWLAAGPGGRTGRKSAAAPFEVQNLYRRLARSMRPITLLTGLGLSVLGTYFRQSHFGNMQCPQCVRRCQLWLLPPWPQLRQMGIRSDGLKLVSRPPRRSGTARQWGRATKRAVKGESLREGGRLLRNRRVP
jgi:hypothetical protein